MLPVRSWTRSADVIAQHVVLPLHMGAFPACCEAVLKAYGADIAEGDAFIINHPYEGGSPHAPDMAVITPVFREERMFGFCGSIAHKSDIGGPVPGSCSGQARETFNEGLHLPALRYVRPRRDSREIERIIAANSRTPELVLGDIRGQIGACRLGEQRIRELIGQIRRGKIASRFRSAARTAMSRRCGRPSRNGPDGCFEAERFIDDDGIELNKPVRIHVAVEKRRDSILAGFFRFGRSDPRSRQCPPSSGKGRGGLCADLARRSADLHQQRHPAQLRN